MIILTKLILAHLLGDFIFQPTAWVKDKEVKKHRSKYLYAHLLLHGILAWVIVAETTFGWFAIILIIVHGLIDAAKLHFQQQQTKRTWFIADQLLHITSITILAYYYDDIQLNFLTISNSFWIVLTAILFVTKPSSIIINTVISIWTPENKLDKENSLENAGNYIGIFERLFIICFVLTDHFEAIGFLLAAKSVFRFGDLKEAKDRKMTEYVLIGSLLSFGLAIATGLAAKYSLTYFF